MDARPNDSRIRRIYRPWETALRRLLPAEGVRLLAAVSGGRDSVVLAGLLRLARERGLVDLALGHIHHGLRREADAEEAFVRDLGRAWGLPVHVRRVRPRETARERGWSLEQAARADRHAALLALCRESGSPVLALGHQMDDQAETVLLRLLRGAGPRGLGGMEPSRPIAVGPGPARVLLIRPLLGYRREELAGVARALGLAWREDRSNRDRRHPRNRIRHELLPLLERDYNQRIVPALAELARWQRMECEPVAQAAEAAAARCVRVTAEGDLGGAAGEGADLGAGGEADRAADPAAGEADRSVGAASCGRRVGVDLAGLSGEPPAVLTRVLWIAYQRLVGPAGILAGRHVDALLEVAGDGSGGPAETHLPGAARARRERGTLWLEYHDPRPGMERRGRAPESS